MPKPSFLSAGDATQEKAQRGPKPRASGAGAITPRAGAWTPLERIVADQRGKAHRETRPALYTPEEQALADLIMANLQMVQGQMERLNRALLARARAGMTVDGLPLGRLSQEVLVDRLETGRHPVEQPIF